MLYYLSAAGLIAHTFFWGLGLAWLALPGGWRRWAWAFAPGFGFALQSAVVWAGAHTALAGTDTYAWWSELLPATLLAVAAGGGALRGQRGWAGLALVLIGTAVLFISPMTKPGRGLTSSSLGSCDQADYAAGARVFQEFARDDRTGFLGQSEVTKVRSADTFFDFWLRLNHFTPSALLAHNATVLEVAPFRLVSITAVVLVLLNLPVMLLLARIGVGVRGYWLLGLVALFGLSPINAYAVYHGALGQLYAAQGIGLLTIAVLGAGRAAQRERSVWPFLPLVLAAFWLLAGSYNFILVVSLAPAAAWLLAKLWLRRKWVRTGRVLALLVTGLALCAGLFWGRFEGLIERFSLFEQYDFGWVVPLSSPEGWLGMTRDAGLNAWPPVVRVILSAGVLGLWASGLLLLWRRQKTLALTALALVLPVIFGWCLLAWETRERANASYDAYKLLSVFYPGLLVGLGCWVAAAQRTGRFVQLGAAGLLGAILAANVVGTGDFRQKMSAPTLRVNPNLVELGRLERDPRFASFNMVLEDFWSRLWANSFLLRKPQYFATHTYEGRLNTALKGEWNLHDSLLRIEPPRAKDFVACNARYYLIRASAEGLLQAGFADGWYPLEHSGLKRWRWSGGQGIIWIDNPTGATVRAKLSLRVQALRPQDFTVRLGPDLIAQRALDGTNQVLAVDSLLVPPGRTNLTLAGTGSTLGPDASDSRMLAFALHDLRLHVRTLER
jgi:hypothetical protein